MRAGGMPATKGSTKDIAALVAYLKSLSSTSGARVASAKPNASSSAASAQPSPPTAATSNPPAAASPVAPVAKTPTPAAVTVASAADTLPKAAAPPATSANQQGAAIFAAQGCAACHGIGGVGTKTAPALTAFSKTLSPAALTNLLQHPNQKMQAGGMPAVAVSATEMTALISYLQHLGAPVTATAAVPAKGSAAPASTSATLSTPDSTPVAAVVAGAPARPMNVGELRGHAVFVAHSCGTCHGMDGVGGSWAGPALANTGKGFPAAVIATMLRHPSARMVQGAMPTVSLSQGELDALAAYVSFISSKAATAPPR
jgi:mono/diheme cytochrome c family protein